MKTNKAAIIIKNIGSKSLFTFSLNILFHNERIKKTKRETNRTIHARAKFIIINNPIIASKRIAVNKFPFLVFSVFVVINPTKSTNITDKNIAKPCIEPDVVLNAGDNITSGNTKELFIADSLLPIICQIPKIEKYAAIRTKNTDRNKVFISEETEIKGENGFAFFSFAPVLGVSGFDITLLVIKKYNMPRLKNPIKPSENFP